MLRLPIDDLGRRRAETRKKWMQNASNPLENLKIFAD
jgi:hypothetical protein